MPKATNHARKKAAKKMVVWRRRNNYRKLIRLAAGYVEDRLREPSFLEQIFPQGRATFNIDDVSLGGDGVCHVDVSVTVIPDVTRMCLVVGEPALTDRERDALKSRMFGELYEFSPPEFVGTPFERKIIGIDAADGPDKTVGMLTSFSPTGRLAPVHVLGPSRDYYIPGDAKGEATVENLVIFDYSAFEHRCAVASAVDVANARVASGEIGGSYREVHAAFREALDAARHKSKEPVTGVVEHGRLSSGLPNFDNIPREPEDE
jgi:hypothetical protein